MKRYLWVIEMLCNGKWSPTVGAHLTKRDAELDKSYDWEYNNPNDKFRIVKYIAIGESK